MIHKSLVVLICAIGFTWAQNKNYAFDFSVGLAISSNGKTYVPIPSTSFYWLRSKGIHELSAEFYTKSISDSNNTKNSVDDEGFGLSYSFLFKLPIKYLYAGPTVGIFSYSSYESEGRLDENYGYGYTYRYTVEEEFGQYFCGGKIALIFGENTIRFKIQDRLLIGVLDKENSSEYGFLNNINMSFLISI